MKKRGPKAKKFCRSVDIMADAAYAILIKDPASCTGNLYFDEDVLKAEQIADLEQYRAEKCKSCSSYVVISYGILSNITSSSPSIEDSAKLIEMEGCNIKTN